MDKPSGERARSQPVLRKRKGERKGKKTFPGKGNHNQDQAGNPDEEAGQRRLNVFGIKRQRIEVVGDVQEHSDEFEMPRVDRAAYVFCVHSCKSVMSDWPEMPSSSRRVVSGVQGSEEPAGTHEMKPDRFTAEVLLAVGCRDDRPIVDSGSVVSTCPVDNATSIPTEKIDFSMNLESMLGESLQHYGIKRKVPFTNRTGGTMNVNFEVTDTKRVILSVHKGCGNGSMIVFTPNGRGKIINDKRCIEHVQQIMGTTPGFNIVYDRGGYVLDVDVNDGVYVNDGSRKSENSGITFPVERTEHWERALSQAQRNCEIMQAIRPEVYGESQNTFDQVKVKVPPKPYEPTKEERQSNEATHCPFRAWCEICVKAKSPDGRHKKQLVASEHIPVMKFDYKFATDPPWRSQQENVDDGCDRRLCMRIIIRFGMFGRRIQETFSREEGRNCELET